MRTDAKRVGSWLVLIVSLCALLGAAVVLVELLLLSRGGVPPVAGRLEVEALEAPVRVLRDSFGIPHIEAARDDEAVLALGLVHAQDRIWQMEVLRRSASGRLSEVFGPTASERDRLARTLGLRLAAEREFAASPPDVRALLVAYSAGVNRWIDEIRERRVPTPFELRWLDIELEDWSPVDTLAIVRLRSWTLSRSLGAGLLLDRLVRELGSRAAQDFFPVTAVDGRPRLARGLFELGRIADRWAAGVGMDGPVGSLGFIVGAERSRSGMPLLVNDVHGQFQLPATFYLAHLRGAGGEISGATWPGIPLFWVGTNREIAWGQVALHASSSDIFDETLHPTQRWKYDRGGRWVEAEHRIEEIRVRGASTELIEVVTTRHGPLLANVRPGDPTVASYAIRWVGQARESGFRALSRLQRSRDWEEFQHALRQYPAPPATFLYADRQGQIGRQVAGHLPIRVIGKGLLPVSGGLRNNDWGGFVPFEELPRALERDVPWLIVTTHPESGEFTHPVAWLWGGSAAAARLEELLGQSPQLQLTDILAIQRDVRSARAPDVLEDLLRGTEGIDGPAARIREVLVTWDGDTSTDSLGASVYHFFRQQLTSLVLEDQLGARPDLLSEIHEAEPVPGALLARYLDRLGPQQSRETLLRALEETWSRLSAEVSGNPRRWTWGKLHRLRLRHGFELLGGRVDRWLGRMLGSRSHPAAGDADSIWTVHHSRLPTASVGVGPVLRYAIDLGDPKSAQVGLAGGQSGHRGSAFCRDALLDWLRGQPRPLWMDWPTVEYLHRGEWLLEPAPSEGVAE